VSDAVGHVAFAQETLDERGLDGELGEHHLDRHRSAVAMRCGEHESHPAHADEAIDRPLAAERGSDALPRLRARETMTQMDVGEVARRHGGVGAVGALRSERSRFGHQRATRLAPGQVLVDACLFALRQTVLEEPGNRIFAKARHAGAGV
jgi:hypothetical protein